MFSGLSMTSRWYCLLYWYSMVILSLLHYCTAVTNYQDLITSPVSVDINLNILILSSLTSHQATKLELED